VLVPADLLELPRGPTAGYPPDPYGQPGARDRAVVGAKARGAAWLDGEIARGAEGTRVVLVLRAPDDREIARGEGTGLFPFQAVRAALGGIAAALPAHPPLDHIQKWFGASTVEGAEALFDLSAALVTEAPRVKQMECQAVAKRTDLDAVGRALAADVCEESSAQDLVGGGDLPPGSAPVDVWRSCTGGAPAPELAQACAAPASDVAGRARCAALRKAAEHQCATALADAASRESSPEGRGRMAWREGLLRQRLEQKGRARELFLLAAQADVKAPPLSICDSLRAISFASDTPDASFNPAYAAWRPWDPLAQASVGDSAGGPDAGLAYWVRAEALAPEGFWANFAAERLLRAGNAAGASAIIARTQDDALRIELAASTARFGAALAEAKRALEQATGPRIEVAQRTVEVAAILGRSQSLVTDQVKLVVEKGHLDLLGYTSMLKLVVLCAQVDKALAARCFEVVRQAGPNGAVPFADLLTAPLDGAERYARGDYAGAARAWRPLLKAPDSYEVEQLRAPLALAFERAGEADLAEKVDAAALARRGLYNGANLAYVRGALRAEKRKDKDTARRLAQAVVDAWSVADDDVPAVEQMRKLLARLR
jgi:hypothetical protein